MWLLLQLQCVRLLASTCVRRVCVLTLYYCCLLTLPVGNPHDEVAAIPR